MEEVAVFNKVSKERFIKSFVEIFKTSLLEAEQIYKDLKIPKRATKGSAGYDFFSPIDFTLKPGETITLPSGIRCKMRNNFVLMLFPRSSLGFKYRLQLDNTVGIIDSDYYYSDNEGQIGIKLTNDSKDGKILEIKKGIAIMQGVFLEFGITVDDNTTEIRNGGFGSTDRAGKS